MPPIDTLDGPRFALRGRVVTMNARDSVLEDGVLYIDRGVIDAVLPAIAAPPEGYEDVVPAESGGTLYPGLIELHNHLAYDVLELWQVPRRFTNRSQWGGSSNPDYGRLVTGPMQVLGRDPEAMPAVVRYVEAKALVNGTTTSQGIALFSNAGSRRMYRGVVRNIEATDDPALPEAKSRIADVEAADARRFLARLQGPNRLFLHLAEGVDARARKHFLALEFEPGRWAITDNLVGIHCAALTAEDFGVLAGHGGSMVWSPLSNLLLYGGTADIAAAKAAGLLIGLGSDWSVSGSKGLLGELKAARLAADLAAERDPTRGGPVLSDRELVVMATRDAARILRWDRVLGSLEPGKRADLIAVAGAAGDPYGALVGARDVDITLVAVDGVPRYGTTRLMEALTPDPGDLEFLAKQAPQDRAVQLRQASADPVVAGLTLADAADRLTAALATLPARAARERDAGTALGGPIGSTPRWNLALDEIQSTGSELRHRLPLPHSAARTPSGPVIDAAGEVAEEDVSDALELDALTAALHPDFLESLRTQVNLPPSYGTRLSGLLT
ncbi:amidohydrolase family protein [Streptomyces pathocidini]|uniref:Amidohydrolase family protein n=1 Tax=Streptomyces pathocidini TaxID=1650571 RepID=A0ABW7UXB5_9ACTN|nr:amidohydrolase family protein [Streptomyces pathocidini]